MNTLPSALMSSHQSIHLQLLQGCLAAVIKYIQHYPLQAVPGQGAYHTAIRLLRILCTFQSLYKGPPCRQHRYLYPNRASIPISQQSVFHSVLILSLNLVIPPILVCDIGTLYSFLLHVVFFSFPFVPSPSSSSQRLFPVKAALYNMIIIATNQYLRQCYTIFMVPFAIFFWRP